MAQALRFDVKADVRKATRQLNKIQKRQIPFAASKGLNDTAEWAATNLNDDTRKYLDQPTPFTQRAFTLKRSSKRNLSAEVFAKRIQDEYLAWQVEGGVQSPRGRAHALPHKDFDIRNKYGNIRRGAIKRLLGRPDTFSGTFRGIAGIWQRGHISKRGKFSTAGKSRATSLRLLFAYERSTRYEKRYPFDRLFTRYVDRGFPTFFERALKRALATAR